MRARTSRRKSPNSGQQHCARPDHCSRQKPDCPAYAAAASTVTMNSSNTALPRRATTALPAGAGAPGPGTRQVARAYSRATFPQHVKVIVRHQWLNECKQASKQQQPEPHGITAWRPRWGSRVLRPALRVPTRTSAPASAFARPHPAGGQRGFPRIDVDGDEVAAAAAAHFVVPRASPAPAAAPCWRPSGWLPSSITVRFPAGSNTWPPPRRARSDSSAAPTVAVAASARAPARYAVASATNCTNSGCMARSFQARSSGAARSAVCRSAFAARAAVACRSRTASAPSNLGRLHRHMAEELDGAPQPRIAQHRVTLVHLGDLAGSLPAARARPLARLAR